MCRLRKTTRLQQASNAAGWQPCKRRHGSKRSANYADSTKKEKNMFAKKIFIALFIAAMTTITAFGQKGAAPSWTSPAGAWVGTVTSGPGGPPPFRVLMNFTADGNFIGSGDGDSFSGASPGHGVWERIGGTSSRTYAVTFLQLFYAP